MIFIVGYHASGKTHFANMLVEQYGVLRIETSDIVRAFKRVDDPDTPMSQWAAQKEAEDGINFFDDLIVDATRFAYVAELEKGIVPQDVVITGNRSLTGVLYAKEQLSDLNDRESYVIGIEVSAELRYQRYKERDRSLGDLDMSYEDFNELTKLEQEAGLDEIIAYASRIIVNNGSEQEFHELGHELARNHLDLMRVSFDGEMLYIRGEGKRLIR